MDKLPRDRDTEPSDLENRYVTLDILNEDRM
jgi:hypothetical protein